MPVPSRSPVLSCVGCSAAGLVLFVAGTSASTATPSASSDDVAAAAAAAGCSYDA